MQSPMTSAAVYPDYFPGFNPDGSAGAKKRTRTHEDHSDLQEIVTGTASGNPDRNAFLYDHFDVPQIINYMAASVLIQDWDRYPKNHFMYRDTEGTGLWQMHPWDADLSWGYAGWWTDSINATHPTMSHPLYGESSYPGVYGQTHRLVDAFHDQPLLRQMFLRRLRTLMDQILQPPATPSGDLVLETEIERLYDLMHVEVDADKAKWGMPFGSEQSLRQAIDVMLSSYLQPRRNNLHNPELYERIIPASQPVDRVITFGTILANPPSGNQGQEYLVISNPSGRYAVDLSGWRIEGGIRFDFPPGTVLNRKGSAHLTQNVRAFLGRPESPSGGEGLLVLGEYKGQLSARGETLTLLRKDGSISDSITYPGDPSQAQDYLRISEIHFAPADPSAAELAVLPDAEGADFEFVELVNLGPEELDLTGVRFIDGVAFSFPNGASLPSGERLVVTRDPAAFALRHGSGRPLVFGPWTGKLDNDGESIELVDASGETILRFAYNDTWFPAAESLAHSLVVRDPAGTGFDLWGEPETWAISAQAEGSPLSGDDSYPQWLAAEFTPAEIADPALTGPDVDLDGNGFGTFMSYALGLDPRSPEPWKYPSFEIVTDGGERDLRYTFRRRKHAIDLTYRVMVSADLHEWTETTVISGEVVDNLDGTETVTIRDTVPAGSIGRRFMRLVVEMN